LPEIVAFPAAVPSKFDSKSDLRRQLSRRGGLRVSRRRGPGSGCRGGFPVAARGWIGRTSRGRPWGFRPGSTPSYSLLPLWRNVLDGGGGEVGYWEDLEIALGAQCLPTGEQEPAVRDLAADVVGDPIAGGQATSPLRSGCATVRAASGSGVPPMLGEGDGAARKSEFAPCGRWGFRHKRDACATGRAI